MGWSKDEAGMRRRFMEYLVANYGEDHPYVQRRKAEYNDRLNAPLPQLVTYAEADRVLREQEAESAEALKAMRALFEAAPKFGVEHLNMPAIKAHAERLGLTVSTPTVDVPAGEVVEQLACIIDPEAFGLPDNCEPNSITDRDIARDRARLVLLALREPTEAMLHAAAGALKAHIEALPAEVRARSKERGGVVFVGPVEKHAVRWRAMVDALSGGQPGGAAEPD